eukprot:TRINITY_DN14263_c0_g1_i2.p1 TRINITY_DN14263_c0_g1~~TRINITY_DN14263_c0_g1_i2.p1  ORF type:complete len:184 (+),score=54.62 TRINITY_DN14263_c0_g1_i2:34-585(+)
MCSSCEDCYPVPVRREYRRRMKHLTVRKMTAVQRIEINRFWNELEDIFDRLEDVRAEYECSTIEEAENILNETAECDDEVEAAFTTYVDEDDTCLCKQSASVTSYEEDNVSCYCSETSSHGGRSSSQLSLEDGYISFHSQDSFQLYQSKYQKPLPLPPSFQQTKPMIEMFQKRNNKSYMVTVL